MLTGGSEAFRILPRIGGYAQLPLVYINEVEAGRATGAQTVGDRASSGDDEAGGALLDGVHRLLVIVATKYQLGSQVREGAKGLLRVGEAVAAGDRTPYRVMVDHDHASGVWRRVREGLLDLLEVALVDVTYHTEIPHATRQGAT